MMHTTRSLVARLQGLAHLSSYVIINPDLLTKKMFCCGAHVNSLNFCVLWARADGKTFEMRQEQKGKNKEGRGSKTVETAERDGEAWMNNLVTPFLFLLRPAELVILQRWEKRGEEREKKRLEETRRGKEMREGKKKWWRQRGTAVIFLRRKVLIFCFWVV